MIFVVALLVLLVLLITLCCCISSCRKRRAAKIEEEEYEALLNPTVRSSSGTPRTDKVRSQMAEKYGGGTKLQPAGGSHAPSYAPQGDFSESPDFT